MSLNTVIDYIFTSSFDHNQGIVIDQSYSNVNNNLSVQDQLGPILDSIIPSNLHKFLNTEHYTIIPLLINQKNGHLLSHIDFNDNENIFLTPCYLFTISYLKFSNDFNRNSQIKAISIITTLPIFQVLKPLLYYLLHESFDINFDKNLIDSAFKNVNNSHLNDLLNHFENLNSASRFVLTRIKPDFDLNDSLKLSPSLSKYFTDSDNLFKTSINLGSSSLNFPIQIPKNSILASSLSMFGLDLQRSSNLKNLIEILNNINIVYPNNIFQESCLTPYLNINSLHVLLNALILNKKVVLYAHNVCYNILTDFAESLYLLFNSSCCSKILKIPFHPIIDLSTMDLIQSNDSYLIGTSNPMLMDKLDWDLFLNFDSNSLHVKILNKTETDLKYFDSHLNLKRNSVNESDNDSKRYSMNSNITKHSMQISTSSFSSNISSFKSFHADERLSYWDPSCFPRLVPNTNIHGLISNNIEPDNTSDFNDISFIPLKFPILVSNNLINSIPRIDKALDLQIERLIKNNHDDETLFILLTNYLRNLTTRILPSFYHFSVFLKIRDYRSYLIINNHLVKRVNGDFNHDLNLMIQNYIKSNNLIQAFPLNYPFDQNKSFLDDPKIVAYYSRIVLANVPLLRLAVHYNSEIFNSVKLMPNFIFSWSGGEENIISQDDDLISDIKEGVDIRLDTHYLINILDRMIDNTSNDSWKLDKYLLLQIFKVLNSILKIKGTGINGLNDVLVDLFIEKRGDESLAKSSGIDLSHKNLPSIPQYKPVRNSSSSSFLSNFTNNKNNSNVKTNMIINKPDNSFEEKLYRLAVSTTNMEFIKDVIRGGNGIEFSDPISPTISSPSSSNTSNSNKKRNSSISKTSKISKEKKCRIDISTEICQDDEIINHIKTLGTQRFTKLILVSALYLSIRGPEDIVETKKGMRRKDLLLTEFKRFLSGVLNDSFFKEFVLVEMDDFVKLTVNDFIDYHM